MMNKKSIKINTILYVIKVVSGTLFPLITYPYVAGILGVEQIGRNDFSKSVVSYFVLFAGLGINTYVIREGAKVRDDQQKSMKLYAEIYMINIISTVISYIALFIVTVSSKKLHGYIVLIAIHSLQIILTTAGKEWILSINEDYLYITIRTIILQILALLCTFTFVKTRDDLLVYAAISIISSSGSQLINYFYTKRYARFSINIHDINIKSHLMPIITIFGMTATVAIYVSSDLTILGFLTGDYYVGLYSTATKIYTIVKTVLSSMLIVAIPRLSAFVGKNDKAGMEKLASEVYCSLLTLLVPAIIGIMVTSKDIVVSFTSEDFYKSYSSLMILGGALFFCMGSWFWGQCIMLSYGMEKTVFLITVISAVTNIVLNFILIPFWKEDAAAFTTLLAEAIAFFCCRYHGRKCVSLKNIESTMIKSIVGSLPIFFYAITIETIIYNALLRLFVIVLISSISYFFVELAVNNCIVRSETKNVIRLIKMKKGLDR